MARELGRPASRRTSSSGDATEVHALLSLLRSPSNSTGEELWSATLNGWTPGSEVPVCEWDGVTCRVGVDGGMEDGVVAEVDLAGKGLSGTIPTELGLLHGLEHLVLKDNMLQGSIPQEIANLEKLVTLDLTECFLTGTLPQRFESPGLTALMLANNAISGKFFQDDDSPHLRSIAVIRMENNLLTGVLHGPTIRKMPALQTLSLSENDLTGLIPGNDLGSLPSLKYLYLDNNRLVGPLPSSLAQVGRSTILELWVQDNALSGTVPASYVRLDSMHDFFIDGNKLTGALPPDLCGPSINADFFAGAPSGTERDYCDSIACPAGSVAPEGVYPCEKCPGGEAARLKNRYLGQTGECDDYGQRDVLKIFHDATTKGGAWRGIGDWADESQEVCDMTGITCDAHGNVVEIKLKDRGLEGHLPDELGFLSFLEVLDVSDNALMGHVPGDLRWTAMRELDVSGNRIRGVVPPLLCMTEGLNGNGEDDVFYCDRVACPEGTYNAFGYHHGRGGEECEPCYDGRPFIAQKACANTKKPTAVTHFVEMAKEKSEEMGSVVGVGIGIAVGVIATVLLMCCFVRWFHSRDGKHYKRGSQGKKKKGGGKRNLQRERSVEVDRESDAVYDYDDEEEEDEDARNYNFADDGPDRLRYQETVPAYHDFVIEDESPGADEEGGAARAAKGGGGFAGGDGDDDYDDEDDNRSRATATSRRSAAELLSDHRGVALSRPQRLKQAVSERIPTNVGQRARDAASRVNVGTRRVRRNSSLTLMSPKGGYDDDGEEEIGFEGNGSERLRTEVELARNSSSMSDVGPPKKLQPSDLLDIPMIT